MTNFLGLRGGHVTARDYYGVSAPPDSGPINSERLSLLIPPGWIPVRTNGLAKVVPTFTRSSVGQGGTQLYSGSVATATPQAFTVASSPLEKDGFGVDTPSGVPCTAHRPISTRLEPASRLRSFYHWFAYAVPSDLARRARTVWQSQHDSPSRGRLPPIAVVPDNRLPRCFIRPLRRPNGDGLSPPPDIPGASWRTSPARRNSLPP